MNMKAIYQTPATLRTSIEPQVILAGSGPASIFESGVPAGGAIGSDTW